MSHDQTGDRHTDGRTTKWSCKGFVFFSLKDPKRRECRATHGNKQSME